MLGILDHVANLCMQNGAHFVSKGLMAASQKVLQTLHQLLRRSRVFHASRLPAESMHVHTQKGEPEFGLLFVFALQIRMQDNTNMRICSHAGRLTREREGKEKLKGNTWTKACNGFHGPQLHFTVTLSVRPPACPFLLFPLLGEDHCLRKNVGFPLWNLCGADTRKHLTAQSAANVCLKALIVPSRLTRVIFPAVLSRVHRRLEIKRHDNST